MKYTFPTYRLLLVSAAKFLVIFTVSMGIATIVNHETYKDYYGKRLFKLHTSDLTTLADQMTIKLNYFLSQGDRQGIQDVLDGNFGLFGFVVTDCLTENRLCPEQKVLFTSDRSLPWSHPPKTEDLASGSFAFLRRLPGITPAKSLSLSKPGIPGEILGRLYVVNNMPHSFSEEFLECIKSPFANVGARRFYLRTTLAFMSGATIIWLISELYFMLRRKQFVLMRNRYQELEQSVNRQMKLLSEKDAQITRLNEHSGRQYEAYVEKIRSLNQKIQNEEEYRQLTEQIIEELEKDKVIESEMYLEELAVVRSDMERLQQKIEQFDQSSSERKESSYKELEEAARSPNFSNVFEQRVFETISASEQFKKGDWRLLINFDVAPGRNYRQFTDFILFNKDALIILEAKYYVGLIDSPGDFLNDIWFSTGSQRKKIDSLWGENPYHQLNEYSMSLMKILKQRSPWNFQIFGAIIFPDEADISKVGDHLGKFYRVTTISKIVTLFESIFAESARFQAQKNPNRPKVEQVENMLRGRKVSA
ncbi:MAG: NERD domain-containing protein [Geobacteraceae bacterium]|nr:NERD domain-containing protein [Geobacteraceae bacterium]